MGVCGEKGGAWSAWERQKGRWVLGRVGAGAEGQGCPSRGQGVTVCVLCGLRPGGHLARSCPLYSLYLVLSKVPPPGCLRLLPLRPSSGSPPLGSLPWLPALPMGESLLGWSWVLAPFPWGVGWVPRHSEPRAAQAWTHGCREPCRGLRLPHLDREATRRPGAPSHVGGLRHCWAPKGSCLRWSWAKPLRGAQRW